LAEKGPAPPPIPPPDWLLQGQPYPGKGKGKGAEIAFNYDADKGPSTGKGKGKGAKSAHDWKLWRRDMKEKRKDPTEGLKYRDGYEAPVATENILPTAMVNIRTPQEQMMTQKRDDKRDIKKLFLARQYGMMTARRSQLLKKGKIQPKRSREEIISLAVWPRRMKRLFTKVQETRSEAEIMDQILTSREELRSAINTSGKEAGIAFHQIRNGSEDECDPHLPQPVQDLTDNEEHWNCTPSPSPNFQEDGFYPSSSDEDMVPKVIPKAVIPKDKAQLEKKPPLVRASTKVKEEKLPARPDWKPGDPGPVDYSEGSNAVKTETVPEEPEGQKDSAEAETKAPKDSPEGEKQLKEKQAVSSADAEEATTISMLEEVHGEVLATAGGFEAIIDSGATASIMNIQTAEGLSHLVKSVDPTKKRKFRTAGGDIIHAVSVAEFDLGQLGISEFHVIDNSSTPTLIGMSSLQGAVLNFKDGTLSRQGKVIQLGKNQNGHYVVNLLE
jgi:predicted aspartyl protease